MLRDVLKFEPESVTLIDLGRELVEFFTATEEQLPVYRQALVDLNEHAFSDERVEVIFGDAFIEVDRLLDRISYYDVILVDLPDPSHPDLDRLYSDHFYKRLNRLLASNGVLVVQSTSPYHAKKAFISIGKTLSISNFNHVEQYRQNIPSFGEWGWSIASKQIQSPRAKLQQQRQPVDHPWLTRDLIVASFEFPRDFFAEADNIEANKLGTNRVYRYHTEAWQKELGIYKN